jgi:hypothetical protein
MFDRPLKRTMTMRPQSAASKKAKPAARQHFGSADGCPNWETYPSAEDRRKAPRETPERRTSRRRQVLKRADIIWRKGLAIDCTVLDISDEGAGLKLRDTVPDIFMLVLDDVSLPCRVVWRKANQVGVRFLT